MNFTTFLIYLIVHCVLLVWAFRNEDKLIEFEQRVIAVLKNKLKARKQNDT